MFQELFDMPIAYDMGIDIKEIRKCKMRKGCKRGFPFKETVIMTSKEVAEVSGQAFMKILKMKGLTYN